MDRLEPKENGVDPEFLLWIADRIAYVHPIEGFVEGNVRRMVHRATVCQLDTLDKGVLKKVIKEFIKGGDRETDPHIMRLNRLAAVPEPEVNQSEDKPPLGIPPRKVCDEQRAKQILEAMERYAGKHIPIPLSWVEELKERLYGAE